MSWEDIKRVGYGLLDLKPDEFYNMDFRDFCDMYVSKQAHIAWMDDLDMQKKAWQTALLMYSSGNFKKPIKPEKLYKSQFDEYGRYIGDQQEETFTEIDKDTKDAELKALFDRVEQGKKKKEE